MEQAPKTVEDYSPGWFKKRAFDSLKKNEDGTWDFSDSLLLYIPGTEESYETIQQVDTPYHTLVTKPERAYLERIAQDVVKELPNEFEYVDLGPGSEHKEQFIFDAAKNQNKHFTYVPVDISQRFLELASKYASDQNIPTHSMRASFEELSTKLGKPTAPRFVSIGLTYSNYAPQEILQLLKEIAGEGGFAFINAQISDRVDMKKLTATYAQDGFNIAKSKLELIGLDSEKDISQTHTDEGIQIWSTLKNSTPQLEKRGIAAGSKLLIFQSLRPTKEKLETDVRQVFPNATFFDTGESYIGALLK